MPPEMRKTARQIRTRQTTFETREEDGARRIEGYFAVFGDVYNMGCGITESIDPHAFDGALGDDVRVLIDHDTRLVLGRTAAGTAELRVDDHGLWGSVLINPEDTDAMNAYARNKRGDVTGASFGFDITEEDKDFRGDGTTHYTVKGLRLYEVSLCTFPAYEQTDLQARASGHDSARQRKTEAWKHRQKERMRKLWH